MPPQCPTVPTPGFDDEEDEEDEESHTHLDAGGDEGGAGDLDELLPAMAPADGASDATRQMAAATEAAVQQALETVQANNAAIAAANAEAVPGHDGAPYPSGGGDGEDRRREQQASADSP